MLTKERIQAIVGIEEDHPLKKYVLTRGGVILESKDLEYDDFMKCFGRFIHNDDNGHDIFEVVVIEEESDDRDELELLVQERGEA